jgi:yersiniabactin salicyl-AMP ligase
MMHRYNGVKRSYCVSKGYWKSIVLGDLPTIWASQYGTKCAIVDGKDTVTYIELEEQINAMAAGFLTLGIQSGERVLVQLPNSINFVKVVFALFKMGAIPIFLLPAHREEEVEAVSSVAQPVAYIVPDNFNNYDYLALSRRIQNKIPTIKAIVVNGDYEEYISLSSLKEKPRHWDKPSYLDTALLLLSGGTTSTPKLIPRTHADYEYNIRAASELCGLHQGSVYLAVLPVAHNFAFGCPGIVGTLAAGGRVVMARSPDVQELFELIERENVTFTALVPVLVDFWLQAKELGVEHGTSLEVIQVGGAHFKESSAKKVLSLLECKLQQVFGMGEGLLCFTRLSDSEEIVIETQGRPLCDDDELKVVDQHDNEVAYGEIGELLTRGPYTIDGYYRSDRHNKKAFTKDGFYRTGDLVRMHKSGNIVAEGRIKEQINRAGEKISVAEIEGQLINHPDIDDVVIVGVEDDCFGERSCAVVISNRSNVIRKSICDYLSNVGLAEYKHPDQVLAVDCWPLTAVGKVDKRELIKLAEQQYAQ